MVFHQAVAKETKAVGGDDLREDVKEGFAVLIVHEDRAFLDPAVEDVVEGVLKVHPSRSGHNSLLYNYSDYYAITPDEPADRSGDPALFDPKGTRPL